MKTKILLIFLLLVTVTGCTPKNNCDMKNTTPKYKLKVKGHIGIGDEILSFDGKVSDGKVPETKLYINPNAGRVCIGETEMTITISIDRYNELTEKSEWLLKDFYVKNDCQTSLWENKKTKEMKEGIGTYPPSTLINLKQLKK